MTSLGAQYITYKHLTTISTTYERALIMFTKIRFLEEDPTKLLDGQYETFANQEGAFQRFHYINDGNNDKRWCGQYIDGNYDICFICNYNCRTVRIKMQRRIPTENFFICVVDIDIRAGLVYC